MNNSRRNISLTAGNIFTGNSRPKTAAVTGLPRPPTAVHGFTKGRAANNMTAGGAYGAFNFVG